MTQRGEAVSRTADVGPVGKAATAAAMLFAALLLVSCKKDECSRSSDCAPDEYCFRGVCTALPPSDADADADADGAPDDRGADLGDDGGPPGDGEGTEGPGEADGAGPDADVEPEADEWDGATSCTTDEECGTGDNPCKTGDCTADGVCVWINRPDGESCADDLWCDGAEECLGGACFEPGIPCPPSTTPCHYASCDEAADSCTEEHTSDGVECGTGGPCGAQLECRGGDCVPDAASACDDHSDCTTDTCVEEIPGAPPFCEYDNAPDGTPCTDDDPCAGVAAGRACVMGICAYASDALCTDGTLGTLTQCDPDYGSCATITTEFVPGLVGCDTSINVSTVHGANDVSDYGSCGTGLTGGEAVYAVELGAGESNLTVTLSDVAVAGGALSVLLLPDHRSPGTCLQSSHGGTTLSAVVTAEREYYVVVDGTGNARAVFAMAVSCH
jgi:hypothetical protein